MNRRESTNSSAQPTANPHRTAAVMALSVAGMNGAATRNSAATSPITTDAATIQPCRHEPDGGGLATTSMARAEVGHPYWRMRLGSVFCCEDTGAGTGNRTVTITPPSGGTCKPSAPFKACTRSTN